MENILDELKVEENKESEVFEDREDFIDEVISFKNVYSFSQ